MCVLCNDSTSPQYFALSHIASLLRAESDRLLIIAGCRGYNDVSTWARAHPNDVTQLRRALQSSAGALSRRQLRIFRDKGIRTLAAGIPDLSDAVLLDIHAEFASTSRHKLRPGLPQYLHDLYKALPAHNRLEEFARRMRSVSRGLRIVAPTVVAVENAHSGHQRRNQSSSGQMLDIANVASFSVARQSVHACAAASDDTNQDDPQAAEDSNVCQIVPHLPPRHYLRSQTAQDLHRHQWQRTALLTGEISSVCETGWKAKWQHAWDADVVTGHTAIFEEQALYAVRCHPSAIDHNAQLAIHDRGVLPGSFAYHGAWCSPSSVWADFLCRGGSRPFHSTLPNPDVSGRQGSNAAR
jgi:hypothetical protein